MPSAGEVGDKMLMAVLYGFNGWDKYIWTGRFVAFALICAAIYAVNMPEAEAYHEDGVLDARLMPHHTHPPGSYWYERYHDPSFVMATIGRTVGGDEPHYAFGIARAIDLGYMARAYIHLPDHDGSIVNVSMSNASAYVEMVRRNATAPHEAAAALPVRTDTITILAAASAPEPLPSLHRDPLTLTPIVSDGHFIPSSTGHYAGVSNPRHATIPHGASQVYFHNAGQVGINVTIAGLDGTDHSQLLGGGSSYVLPAGGYNYSMSAPGYALSWNGTIRMP